MANSFASRNKNWQGNKFNLSPTNPLSINLSHKPAYYFEVGNDGTRYKGFCHYLVAEVEIELDTKQNLTTPVRREAINQT